MPNSFFSKLEFSESYIKIRNHSVYILELNAPFLFSFFLSTEEVEQTRNKANTIKSKD